MGHWKPRSQRLRFPWDVADPATILKGGRGGTTTRCKVGGGGRLRRPSTHMPTQVASSDHISDADGNDTGGAGRGAESGWPTCRRAPASRRIPIPAECAAEYPAESFCRPARRENIARRQRRDLRPSLLQIRTQVTGMHSLLGRWARMAEGASARPQQPGAGRLPLPSAPPISSSLARARRRRRHTPCWRPRLIQRHPYARAPPRFIWHARFRRRFRTSIDCDWTI